MSRAAPSPSVTQAFSPFPDFLEFLHNVIQDAQASGAIVHMVTIWPPHKVVTPSDGGPPLGGALEDSQDCKPSGSCPKSNA